MTDPSLSADGAVMAFTSDAPDLAPAKTDRSRGVFVRDLRAGTTTLVSAPTKPAARQGAAADGHGAQGARPGEHRHARRAADQHPRQRLRPRPRGPDAAGHPRDGRHLALAQPVLAQRDGALGPQHFRSPTRSRGVFARRLIRAGTYRIVCTLHSPGMGMTVVVR